jgi:hypothetical protein
MTPRSLKLFSVIVIIVIRGHFEIIAGDLVTLLDPRAKIDHLAALGTERAMRIVFPRGLDTTSRTLDRTRHGIPMFMPLIFRKTILPQ